MPTTCCIVRLQVGKPISSERSAPSAKRSRPCLSQQPSRSSRCTSTCSASTTASTSMGFGAQRRKTPPRRRAPPRSAGGPRAIIGAARLPHVDNRDIGARPPRIGPPLHAYSGCPRKTRGQPPLNPTICLDNRDIGAGRNLAARIFRLSMRFASSSAFRPLIFHRKPAYV